MLKRKAIEVLANVNKLQMENSKFKESLAEDPTNFIKNALKIAGLNIPEIDSEGFHAHVINKGEELPDEPIQGTKNREIYFFKSEGNYEYRKVKAGSQTDKKIIENDSILKKAENKCECEYLCCIFCPSSATI